MRSFQATDPVEIASWIAKEIAQAVATLCPTSLLALQYFLQRPPAQASPLGASQPATFAMVQMLGTNVIDFFTLHDGLPTSWAMLPPKAADLVRHMQMTPLANSQPARVLALGLDESLQNSLTAENIEVQ